MILKFFLFLAEFGRVVGPVASGNGSGTIILSFCIMFYTYVNVY